LDNESIYRPRPNRSKPAIQRAKSARQSPSVAEEIVWHLLRNGRLGFKFRREHPVLQYRLDFFCAEARLAVEFDGEQHDAGRDAKRDGELAKLGIEVLRIPNRSFFMLDREPPIDHFRQILLRCEERTGRKGIAFWK
jgi:very-short-patch-repair endonuclease